MIGLLPWWQTVKIDFAMFDKLHHVTRVLCWNWVILRCKYVQYWEFEPDVVAHSSCQNNKQPKLCSAGCLSMELFNLKRSLQILLFWHFDTNGLVSLVTNYHGKTVFPNVRQAPSCQGGPLLDLGQGDDLYVSSTDVTKPLPSSFKSSINSRSPAGHEYCANCGNRGPLQEDGWCSFTSWGNLSLGLCPNLDLINRCFQFQSWSSSYLLSLCIGIGPASWNIFEVLKAYSNWPSLLLLFRCTSSRWAFS